MKRDFNLVGLPKDYGYKLLFKVFNKIDDDFFARLQTLDIDIGLKPLSDDIDPCFIIDKSSIYNYYIISFELRGNYYFEICDYDKLKSIISEFLSCHSSGTYSVFPVLLSDRAKNQLELEFYTSKSNFYKFLKECENIE